MRVAPLALALLLAAPALAQDPPIPDTTEAWRYFPMGIGDVWEYRVTLELVPPDCFPSCTYYQTREVVGDTLVAGTMYRSVEYRSFWLDGTPYGSPERHPVRFDTASARVLSAWASGVYVVHVTAGGQRATARLVRQ